MANRVPPTLHYADNSSGSLPAACNVWRRSDADSMSAPTTTESTTDAGYTTAGFLPLGPRIGQALVVVGESIYDLLASIATTPSCQHIAQLLHRQVWIASMKHSVAVGAHQGQILRFRLRGPIELVNGYSVMRFDKAFP